MPDVVTAPPDTGTPEVILPGDTEPVGLPPYPNGLWDSEEGHAHDGTAGNGGPIQGSSIHGAVALATHATTADTASSAATADTLGGYEAADLIPAYGSNANGSWTRLPDGTQVCVAALTLAYAAGFALRYDWTFPQPFVAAPPYVDHTPNLTGKVLSNDETMLGLTCTQDTTATTTKLYQMRVSGHTDFGAGNTLPTRAVAIGRWK